MRAIICGSRYWNDWRSIFKALDEIHARTQISCAITGGAPGVDFHAWQWALDRKVDRVVYPADWKQHGRAAGPIRNQQMLDEGCPDVVIAFPGGTGTANMIGLASRRGVNVIQLDVRDST